MRKKPSIPVDCITTGSSGRHWRVDRDVRSKHLFYSIIDYRQRCAIRMQKCPSKNSLCAWLLMTAVLWVVSALEFWFSLQ